MFRRILPALLVLGLIAACSAPEPKKGPEKAIALITPANGSNVSGVVKLKQGSSFVFLDVQLSGLKPNQEHGFHIHKLGNITEADGTGTGGHYDPEGVPHALPPGKRHAGDLGNLLADANGNVDIRLESSRFSIGGKNPVLGRAFILHQNPDDGISQPSGAAGPRIGQGVIGLSE